MTLKSIIVAAVVAAGSCAVTAQATPTWTWTVQGTSRGVDQLGLFGPADALLSGPVTQIITASIDPGQYSSSFINSHSAGLQGPSQAGFTETITVNGITLTETIASSSSGILLLDNMLSQTLNYNHNEDQAWFDQSGRDASGNLIFARAFANSFSTPFLPSLDFSQTITLSSKNTSLVGIFEVDNPNGKYTTLQISPDTITINASTVPEPASLALLGVGLAGIGALGRRKAS